MATEFTPFASLVGGGLIGLSAVLLMLLMGRIMGATGILAGVIAPKEVQEVAWRLPLLLGMVSAPLALFAVMGSFPEINVPGSKAMIAIGGFIVGVGVTFGGGCTSGHGVCGIARRSPRSVAATAVFMLSTGLTVFVVRHVLELY